LRFTAHHNNSDCLSTVTELLVMPKSKKQKGSQPKVGKKKSTPSRQGGQKFTSAPSAVSGFMRQEVSFGGSKSLQMTATCVLAEIGQNSTDNGALVNSTHYLQSETLSPTGEGVLVAGGALAAGAPWISPVFDLIASAFTRYRVKRCRFHYRPQAPTTLSQRLFFAFAADAAHPLVLTTVPSQPQLEALADSIPFAPWTEWSMDVSRSLDRETWLYTKSDDATPTTEIDILQRFANFGSISCLADTIGTASVIFGVLYLELDIEFKEFCPITDAGVAMAEKPSPTSPARRPTLCLSAKPSASSSTTTKQVYKTLGLEEFRAYIREARSEGMDMEKAVNSVSSRYILSGPAMELVLHSGLIHVLSHPSLHPESLLQKLEVKNSPINDDAIERVPIGVPGPCLSSAKLDSSVPKAKGLLE